MSQLNSQPVSLTLPPASISAPKPARWLMVLVPYVEVDLTVATRRIWELANAAGARVRFIALYGNAMQELSLRRQLAGMSAMVNTGGVFAETELVFGRDWVEIVRSRWHDGDVVVCFGEQRVGRSNSLLSNVMESNLAMPVYILDGLYPQKNLHSSWLAQILAWSGFIGIILGFFLFQVHINVSFTDWTNIALLLLSMALELWMIWLWNGLFV